MFLLGATAATAQTAKFALTSNVAAPGGSVTFAGSGCFTDGTTLPPEGPRLTPSAGLTGLFVDIHYDTLTGAFTGTITIPATAVPGTYTITARCDRSTRSFFGPPFDYPPQPLTISGPAPTTTEAPSPTTTSTISSPTSTIPAQPTTTSEAPATATTTLATTTVPSADTTADTSNGSADTAAFALDTSVSAPGTTITFRGTGCTFDPTTLPPESGPTISVAGLSGLSIHFDVNAGTGSFTGSIAIPGTATPGNYLVVARCQRSRHSRLGPPFTYSAQPLALQSASTTATATSRTRAATAQSTATSPGLPVTGDDTTSLVVVSLGCIVLGGLLLLGARRRHAAATGE